MSWSLASKRSTPIPVFSKGFWKNTSKLRSKLAFKPDSGGVASKAYPPPGPSALRADRRSTQSQLALNTAALCRLTAACGCKLGSSASTGEGGGGEVGGDGGSKPVGSSEKNTMAGENMMRADVLFCKNHREAWEKHQRGR